MVDDGHGANSGARPYVGTAPVSVRIPIPIQSTAA